MKLDTLHAYLKLRNDLWTSGWEITQACRTSAVSTRISDLRQKGVEIESKREKDGWYYRLKQPAEPQGTLWAYLLLVVPYVILYA